MSNEEKALVIVPPSKAMLDIRTQSQWTILVELLPTRGKSNQTFDGPVNVVRFDFLCAAIGLDGYD
jgi:hypothetical protein